MTDSEIKQEQTQDPFTQTQQQSPYTPQMQQQFFNPQMQYQQNPASQAQYQYANPQMQYQQMMQMPPAQNYFYIPTNNQNITEDDLPENLRPLGAWAYFGYSLLFSLPFVGFIILIVLTFAANNINLRNYARSYWCAYLVAAIIALLIIIFAAGIIS